MSTPDQPPSAADSADLPQRTTSESAKPESSKPEVSIVWSEALRRVPGIPSSRALFSRRAKRAVLQCIAQVPPLHPSLAERWPQMAAQSTVDISFISDHEIARLNGEYRNKPRPTDVLSFSLWENAEAWPQTGELPLGDVIISLETALRQAAEHQREPADEVAFLAIHGTLHLLGYDHENAADRKLMWKWQDQLFHDFLGARAKRASSLDFSLVS